MARNLQRNKEYQRQKREQWRTDGRCLVRGCVMDRNGSLCSACLQKQRQRAVMRAAERKAGDRCYRCNQPRETYVSRSVDYPQCAKCFFAATAFHHLGSRELGCELQRLFENQQRRCKYTRKLLILGDDASLDHIQARARGGLDAVLNFQWVTKQINDCKRALSHVEFVALCREVVANATD